MGAYPLCENCSDFDTTPNSISNKENLSIIKNDSYISFHQETNEPKLAENNINNILNISKKSSEEKKEKNINENQSIENARIPKKEMPSNKNNENRTRNIVNELIEINNENNLNDKDIIDTTNLNNDNKNANYENENEKINNEIIIDNISPKSEKSQEKQIDINNNNYNNIQEENIVINNNKKSRTELNIYNIISKNKLEQLQENSILCHGFLEKIIKIPSKNKFIYNERFCVLTKKNFSYFKSKENYLNLWKPLFSIDVQYIKKIEQTVSDDKTFYFGLICAINDETRQYVKKINTFVNNNENNKEEFLIGFRSKNKEMILRWIVVLNYCLDNYQNN